MTISTILNFSLALALVFLCAKLAMSGGAGSQASAGDDVVYNNILSRTYLFVPIKAKPWRKIRWKSCSALVWRRLRL